MTASTRRPHLLQGCTESGRLPTPLPEAHDVIALTLGRLRPLRLRLNQRARDAGEQSVADRRDEMRRDTNLRRLLVVVGEAETCFDNTRTLYTRS